MTKILLLEDDISLIDGLEYVLQKNDFDVKTVRCVSEALEQLNSIALISQYNLLLLDVTLPDGTGFDVCKKVRELNRLIPIIFLTAADEEVNVIRGLDGGADDYITKPFKLGELCSRIRALLRRACLNAQQTASEPDASILDASISDSFISDTFISDAFILDASIPDAFVSDAFMPDQSFSDKIYLDKASSAKTLLTCGSLTIDFAASRVLLNHRPLELTLAEYRMLSLLVRNADHVVTRKIIMDELWDHMGNFVDDNTLSVYIRRLREKLETNPSQPEHLVTVRGFGYRWIP